MIRRAEAADAREIGELHLRSWWWAYRDVVDHQVLTDHDPDEREARWTELLAGGADVWVRVEDDRIAGFVALEPPELSAMAVDPSAQGAGVGSALLAFAEERLRSTSPAPGSLWCLRDDGQARAFFEGRGWALAGDERDGAWGPELRYAKGLV